jgi:PPM family protein phosphatase
VLPETEEHARHHGWLFVLADGVGGHERGEVASQMAVQHLTRNFRQATHGEAASATLQRLIQRANLEIYEAAMATGPAGRSMATTVVSCVLRYDRATVAHVGDSRCYLLRHGRAHAITRDHTVSQEQLRMGLITVRDAAGAQTANVLSRSVGGDMIVNVDIEEEQIYPGDVLVLCSDGLHNSVKERDLTEIAGAGAPLDQAAERLIALARERDGRDNISVQLIRINTVERVGLYRGRHYKLR